LKVVKYFMLVLFVNLISLQVSLPLFNCWTMDVIIHSNVTGLLGTSVISTDPEQTIDQLLRAFCRDKGVHDRLDLVLTNCRDEVLHARRKLASYDVRNGEELYVSGEGQ